MNPKYQNTENSQQPASIYMNEAYTQIDEHNNRRDNIEIPTLKISHHQQKQRQSLPQYVLQSEI